MTDEHPGGAEGDRGPVQPGPGLRWAGDGSLAPPPLPTATAPDPPLVDEVRVGAGPLVVARGRDRIVNGMVLAGMPRRLACWMIDRLIKAFIFTVVTLVAGVEPTPATLLSPGVAAGFMLLSGGYEFLFGISGVTPGASLMRVRIARLDGGEPGPWRSLVRAAGSVLNETVFFLGTLVAFGHPRRQAMYDRVAGTIVVRTAPKGAPRAEDR